MSVDGYGVDGYGVQVRWTDALDREQQVPEHVLAALHTAIGEPPIDAEASGPLVLRPGAPLEPGEPSAGPMEVECEDGTVRHVDGRLPEDFPLGYHRIRTPGGADRRLIVSPGRCWEPPAEQAWGLAVQVYALRSAASWGIGDLADLRAVREWAQARGAGFLLVNPLHAVAPTSASSGPRETSPYLPATRRFFDPIYLRVDEVAGAERVDLGEYQAEAARLPADDVDRDAAWRLKRSALLAVRAAAGNHPDEVVWRQQRGVPLQVFATWCALAESHGPDWRLWPESLRTPGSDEVAHFAAEHADEVDFHAWLQWSLDRQLRTAAGALKVLQDLPIGVGGAGADAWAWRDQLAHRVRIGAPPDAFNAAGQDWGSPPLVPWRLRLADYEPFVEAVRATVASSGGIRIDHVMGLFRLWWVPGGAGPAEGAYVRYPAGDLLDIVALESHRARALVVGEDLGTVEPGVREELAARGVLSYKVLWFEDDDPASWPVSSMAAVATHDLPTVAGLWTGEDVAEQEALGIGTPAELAAGREEILGRLCGPGELDRSASAEQAVDAAHRLLARAPSRLLCATLEDAVGEPRRPNVPGTTDRPNWRLPLPVRVEDLPRHPQADALTALLDDAVRARAAGVVPG